MDWITIALSLIDWGITRAESAGEEIPADILAARTALRLQLVQSADEESTDE